MLQDRSHAFLCVQGVAAYRMGGRDGREGQERPAGIGREGLERQKGVTTEYLEGDAVKVVSSLRKCNCTVSRVVGFCFGRVATVFFFFRFFY